MLRSAHRATMVALFFNTALHLGCTTNDHGHVTPGITGGSAAVGGTSGSGGTAVAAGTQALPTADTGGMPDSGTRSTDSSTGGADAAVDDAGSAGTGGSSVPACTPADTTGCLDEVAGTSMSDFGNHWKDSWFIMGCPQHDADGHDCVTVPNCPNQDAPNFEDRGAVATETFPLGGTTGTTYAVSFQFNGLSEGKYYQGGQYAKSDVDVATPGGPDSSVNESGVNAGTFYIGGSAMATNYNVMRLRVLDPDRHEVARYYMNAYPQSSGAESHRAFLMSYQHTIDVPGKGFIEYRFQDSNCKAIDNCGAGDVNTANCSGARFLPNEANATLPAMYTDPAAPTQPHLVPTASLNPVNGAMQPWHAQLAHLTVTKIVPK